jgi:hypothetical protein
MSGSRLLEDVREDQCFFVNDGSSVRNIFDLLDRIRSMPLHTFVHHVNDDRNDFRNWIRDVLDDEVLASRLDGKSSRNELADEIQARIDELRQEKSESQVQAMDQDDDALEIPTHKDAVLEPEPAGIKPEGKESSRSKMHLTSGLIDFLGGLALGVVIGLFLARLIF